MVPFVLSCALHSPSNCNDLQQVKSQTSSLYSEAAVRLSLADLGGGREGRTPPPVQILSISCSFRENLACSRGGFTPPLGKILDPPLVIATPRGSGRESINTSVAAWKDPIDLYCVKHTEWQWHLKRCCEQQRSNQSQTHFLSINASHCSGFLLIQLYCCDVLPFCKCHLLFCFVNKNATNLK